MSDSTAAPPGSDDNPALRLDAAEQLFQMWHSGQRPDVDAFLAAAGPLPPDTVAKVLRVDQRERRLAGERVPAESYLQRFPALRASAEAAVDLIYGEFLLRERDGERPTVEEYRQRFPEHAATLQAQIELHRAMAAEPGADTLPAVGPGEELAPTPAVGPGEPPALPTTFGRYRIVRLLGRGGMAAVYLAHDTRLDRAVALKVPRFGPDEGARVVERFEREARIAATFMHPHLCPVYDVGQVDGVHYLTMPFLEGEPLSERLVREGPLPQEEAARLARQIAEAVEVAHGVGVVHRDLKPANVMVNERGEPVVMDFGLARRTAVDPRLTESGGLVGTPAYCAPERIGAGADAVGPAGDVYSLGVILYEMLTGRPPFGGQLSEVLRRLLTEEPQPPSRHRPDLDPRLEAICLRAMAQEPAARFSSMAAFASALGAYLRGEPVPAGLVPGRPARRGTHALTRPAVIALAAGLLGLLAVAVLFLQRGRHDHVPPGDPLRAGSVWKGTFHFRPPFEAQGPVEVRVTKREGERFWGTYATEGGRYEWRIEGTTGEGGVGWEFTEVIHEEEPQDVVGQAHVRGTFDSKVMDVVFYHEMDHSTADMHLGPVE
jgi:hypothetical protein